MSRRSALVFAAAVSLCTRAAEAQVDDPIELFFEGPETVRPPSGATVAREFRCLLEHRGEQPAVRGWSFGVELDGPEGSRLLGATTTGTAFDELANLGFQIAELTTDPDRNGIVAIGVLDIWSPVFLPIGQSLTVLRLEADIAATSEPATATLRYVSDLHRGEHPIPTLVTLIDEPVEPVTRELRVAVEPDRDCCGAGYNFGFSRHRVLDAEPFADILDVTGRCGAEGLVESDGPARIFCNVSSSARYGVQGWQVVLAVTEELTVTSATVDGTSAAPAPDGRFWRGFEATRLLDRTAEGLAGVQSAVVLSFGSSGTLDPVGTESVLALTIGQRYPGRARALGRLTFYEELRLFDVLQPVAVVADGTMVPACNQATASLEIRLASRRLFLRGDVNADAKVDVADAIWLLRELFYGGAAASCRAAGDVNVDGDIDIADALHLIAYRFAAGPPPGGTFPECEAPRPEGGEASACELSHACGN